MKEIPPMIFISEVKCKAVATPAQNNIGCPEKLAHNDEALKEANGPFNQFSVEISSTGTFTPLPGAI